MWGPEKGKKPLDPGKGDTFIHASIVGMKELYERGSGYWRRANSFRELNLTEVCTQPIINVVLRIHLQNRAPDLCCSKAFSNNLAGSSQATSIIHEEGKVNMNQKHFQNNHAKNPLSMKLRYCAAGPPQNAERHSAAIKDGKQDERGTV